MVSRGDASGFLIFTTCASASLRVSWRQACDHMQMLGKVSAHPRGAIVVLQRLG